MIKHNISFIKGDSHVFYFSLPKLLYSHISKLYYTVKESFDGKVLMRKTLENDVKLFYEDEEREHYVLFFNATDTDGFEANKNYIHEIEAIIKDSKKTLMQGNLKLINEITKTKNEK